jgi:outer membrane cobalamin receptor
MYPAFRRISVALLFWFLSNAFPLQSQVVTANLSGAITDPSGASVSGAQLSAEPLDSTSDTSIRALSGSDGRYKLNLPPGHYCLRVVHESFAAREFILVLAPGESKTLNVRLEMEPLSASVVVTAQAEPLEVNRSPAPVSILSRAQLDQSPETSLAEVLLFQPSISVGRTGAEGGTTSIFLNGGNSDFTKVLVDGTPINEPGSAVDFSNFTLDNVDKVEIVRGAESALYGTDAVSGVIQVFTHRGDTTTPELSLFGEGGSFSTGRGGAQASGLLGRFDYSAAAAYLETSGQGPNDGFLDRTLSGNFGWRFSHTNQLRLSLRNNASDAGIPGQTLLLPPALHQGSVLHSFSANARWDFSSGTHWHYQVSGAESYNREHLFNTLADYYDPGDPFCTPVSPTAVQSFTCDYPYDTRNQYNRAGGSAQATYLVPQGAFTAGYQYEVENGWLTFISGHARRNNQGGFLDGHWQALSRLTLSAGVRAEDNANFGTRVVPRAGLLFVAHLGDGFWGDTRLHAFYGQGIKEPNFDQSFGTSPCYPGNPALRPEASRTWDAGIEQKLASDHLNVSMDYFSDRFYDMVSFDYCLPATPGLPPPPCPVTPPPASECSAGSGYYFNTDLARARGATVEAEAKPFRWLKVAANYTYDDSRVLVSPTATDPAELPGNRLLRRPLNSGSLAFNSSFRRMTFSLTGYFTGPCTDSDFLGLDYTDASLRHDPGYARFDFATSYELHAGFSLYARATNVLNRQYEDALGYPALGRDLRLGMKYTRRPKE